MKSSDSSAALEPARVRGARAAGLPATVISARIWPSPGVSISSARHATGSSPKRLGRGRARGCSSGRSRKPRPCRRRAARCWRPRRGGQREHRAALAVEVAGEDVEDVDEPARQGPELLGAGADPAVDGGRSAPRQLARDAAGCRRRRSRGSPATASGVKGAASASDRRRARAGARPAGPGSARPSSKRTLAIANRRWASVPGRMKRCSSATSAVRLRRGSTTTTLPPRSRMPPQAAAHVGRGQQAAVRGERVGAEDQQVVGAVEVGHRDAIRPARTSGRPRPAWASGRRVLALKMLLVPSALSSDAAVDEGGEVVGVGVAEVDRRPRRGRAPRGSAAGGASISANASSQEAGSDESAVARTSGVRTRSGSSCELARAPAPFGQMKPWLKTSSRVALDRG